MAQNVRIAGASYTDVPAVDLPKSVGGTARFVDTSDANATASKMASGYSGYVNGAKVSGTLVAQAAKTVAPSASSQTAVASGRYTTGDVTVAAVPTETKTVNLSMASGNQSVAPTSGKFMTSVTVNKPSTLIPSNIKKDVDIGGVVGTFEGGIAPQYSIGTATFTPGSGALQATFTGLRGQPLMFAVTIADDLPTATSSSHSRCVCVVYDGANTYGNYLDNSQARYRTASWTWTYSNGTLTVKSNSKLDGGYFHTAQYKLVYIYAN